MQQELNLYDSNYAKAFCERFIVSDAPRFVLGRNKFAASIVRHFSIDGIIDDFAEGDTFCDLPVVKADAVPDNALVVSSVIGKPFTAERRLRQFKFEFLDYFFFYKYCGREIEQVLFWEGFLDEYSRHKHRFDEVFELLADQESQKVFEDIINFRLTYDLEYMRGYTDREKEQYFEDFLKFSIGDVFVDIGGFDGFTSQEFIKRCPAYGAIHFFEPDTINMAAAGKLLGSHENIHMYPFGASDSDRTIRFSHMGSASAICDDGDLEIEVRQLDNMIDGPVHFIKMDIEGEELPALHGSARLIREYHPALAICVYHRKDDFWKIPQYVRSLYSDYRIYMRHYTEGISETVMFFVS